MTFNPAIPGPTDLISASQSQIQTNFSQSNTAFGIDHTAFDVLTNQGKHKKSTYVEQAVDPVTAANELALYSKDLAGVSTLYMRKESSGTVIQMSGVDPTLATQGKTFLPGGLIIQWVTYTINNGSSTATVSFAAAFPTAVYSLTITCSAFNGGNVPGDLLVNYTGLGLSQFTGQRINAPATGANYSYIAIGR